MYKEFYFVRHGQTDHNLFHVKDTSVYVEDISLNETGKNQAKLIKPIISVLPIKTVCSSPLKRAIETREIIADSLSLSYFVVDDFSECSYEVWKEMTQSEKKAAYPFESRVHHFVNQVRKGLDQTLSLTGPSLIVAHGGVHWAICHLLGVDSHEWIIDNCVPVHFSLQSEGNWRARKLVS